MSVTGGGGDHWWAVILTGADPVPADHLVWNRGPRAFCSLSATASLLERAQHRAAKLIAPHRTLLTLCRAHERDYAPLVSHLDGTTLVMQALDRGTAPAVLHALIRIASVAPAATVVLFPCHDDATDDGALIEGVYRAFEAVRRCPDFVVLLGVVPAGPDTARGWIEPGAPLGLGLRHVQRLVDGRDVRPPLSAAGLSNSRVTVGSASMLLSLIHQALPWVDEAFTFVRQVVGGPLETAAAARAYVSLSPADFFRDILARDPSRLAVLPVPGVP